MIRLRVAHAAVKTNHRASDVSRDGECGQMPHVLSASATHYEVVASGFHHVIVKRKYCWVDVVRSPTIEHAIGKVVNERLPSRSVNLDRVRFQNHRSEEERRVGKEGRSRWPP